MVNLSILIHTFNGYKHVWPGCIKSWEKHYLTKDCPVYWGTDLPTDIKALSHFDVLYSGKGEWSDRLTKLLRKIPTDYVLYMQEDHWLTRRPPDLNKMMQLVTDQNLLRLQLSPVVRFYSLYGDDKPLLYFDINSKYLVSHQPSIWKKSFFMDQLRYSEDPWKNEYEGTKRLNAKTWVSGKIAIYPYSWYKHTCVRGELIET
jgi:hypothetical protein